MRKLRFAGVCVCVAVLLGSACSDDGDSKDSKKKKSGTTTTTTLAGGSTTTTTGQGGTGNILPAVAVGTAAPLAENLFVTVTKVEPVTLEAHGIGETKGPGVVVTVQLRNATSTALDMNGMVVNAHYGNGTPATPNNAPPADALEGSLAPGQTATGKYAFRLPADQTGSLVFDLQHSGAPNVVVVDVSKK